MIRHINSNSGFSIVRTGIKSTTIAEDDTPVDGTSTGGTVSSEKTAPLLAVGPQAISPQADSVLVETDQFRADPRFAGIDGRGVSVVVIDTGIDLDHPFFGPDADHNGVADRIVFSYDFAGANDADASDRHGHGSNVSSIVGSQDGTYTGMAPGVNIIALKVFSDAGNSASSSDIAEALDWVVAHRAVYNIVAVNLSLGFGNNQNRPSASPWASQFATLAANNTTIVAASGNSFATYQTQGVSSPASDPNAWSIGAVWDRDAGGFAWSGGAIDYSTGADRITSFSQRSSSMTTIFAPGGRITGANWDGGTVSYSGTSQATPHIAGLVADMQQLALRVSGHLLSVDRLKQDMIAGSVTIYDGDDEDDNVSNTLTAYHRVDAVGWATEVLADLFAGTAGADRLNGTVTADTIHGDLGNDTLNGNDGDDTLDGNAGNDTLGGGAGADTMAGGAGNDLYSVDDAGDRVLEAVGEGTDTVRASVDYTLGDGQAIENLRAGARSVGLALGGNGVDNSIVGGAGDDALDGGAGNDRLIGSAGDDVLSGGVGNDRLNGGTGADTMTGGIGNDVYHVDDVGDRAIDAVGEGTDTVYARIDYTLGADQEVERVRANAGAAGLVLGGNGFNNTILGGAGNDTLSGGGGNDKLTGDLGSDIFRFDSAFIGVANVDTVADFSAVNDMIELDHTYFAGLALGLLSASAFAIGNSGGTAPQIVYNTSTGSLSYDGNGADVGGASSFATLTGAPALNETRFFVV